MLAAIISCCYKPVMTFFFYSANKKRGFFKTIMVTVFNLMQTMLHKMQKCFFSFGYSYALQKMNGLGVLRISSYLCSISVLLYYIIFSIVLVDP